MPPHAHTADVADQRRAILSVAAPSSLRQEPLSAAFSLAIWDGIASAHADELSGAIPGFAEALAWPDGELAMGPC